jgi:hypothetical protein
VLGFIFVGGGYIPSSIKDTKIENKCDAKIKTLE